MTQKPQLGENIPSVSPDDVRQILSSGEREGVEFKRQMPTPTALSQQLVAFAGQRGGVLLIGVADQGEIIGVPPDQVSRLSETVAQVASEALFQPCSCHPGIH